jgi:hypothetical protein
MDLVNDLSSDVALAVFVEGRLRKKLEGRDAKSFIALVEAELSRIGADEAKRDTSNSLTATLSH